MNAVMTGFVDRFCMFRRCPDSSVMFLAGAVENGSGAMSEARGMVVYPF